RARRLALRGALRDAGLLPEADTADLFRTCPYELRTRALDERLEPYELGRVFLHLAQRRGFLSNRKTDGGDGDRSATLSSISTLAQSIEVRGARTLGEYLHWAGRDARAGD